METGKLRVKMQANQNGNHQRILVLWDIDGTLMHCGSDGTRALNRTFEKLYGVEEAFRHAGIGSAMDTVILHRIMDYFGLDKADLDLVKKCYMEALIEVLNENNEKRVLPGVLKILDFIEHTEHLFSGLLTSNLRTGAETKLRSVGLLDYFHFGGFGDQIGEKWDAALLAVEQAQELYGITFLRENTYIIGDSPYDIKCAKLLGMKSIGVATGWMDYESLQKEAPDFLFQDLSDYQQIIGIFADS